MSRRPTAALAALVLTVMAGNARADDPPANEFCPVMPRERAVPEHNGRYLGRTVYFCCATCVRKFEADPKPYAANLPAALQSPPPAGGGAAAGLAVPTVTHWTDHFQPLFEAADFADRHTAAFAYLLAVLVLALVAGRAGRPRADGRPPGRLRRWVRPLGRPGVVVSLALLGACVELVREVRAARAATAAARTAAEQAAARPGATARVHAASTWAWPQAMHALPKGISNTYYRGNDERSDKLFNGGAYRTATFRVSVRAEDGREVAAGESVAGGRLSVRLEVERAAGAAANFFTREAMGPVFVVPAGAEGATAAIPLTTRRAEWEWAADLPVGTPAATGYTGSKGVWHLCVGGEAGKPNPAQAVVHYAVHHALHFENGVLLPESVVWMTSVYPSPILNGPKADGEWFSDRPIPEITGGDPARPPSAPPPRPKP